MLLAHATQYALQKDNGHIASWSKVSATADIHASCRSTVTGIHPLMHVMCTRIRRQQAEHVCRCMPLWCCPYCGTQAVMMAHPSRYMPHLCWQTAATAPGPGAPCRRDRTGPARPAWSCQPAQEQVSACPRVAWRVWRGRETDDMTQSCKQVLMRGGRGNPSASAPCHSCLTGRHCALRGPQDCDRRATCSTMAHNQSSWAPVSLCKRHTGCRVDVPHRSSAVALADVGRPLPDELVQHAVAFDLPRTQGTS